MSVHAPPPGGEVAQERPPTPCPSCGTPVPDGQYWCLQCGAPARTRIVTATGWRMPILVAALLVVLALGALGFAFARLTRGTSTPARSVVPATTAPPPAAPAPAVPPVTTPIPVGPTGTTGAATGATGPVGGGATGAGGTIGARARHRHARAGATGTGVPGASGPTGPHGRTRKGGTRTTP